MTPTKTTEPRPAAKPAARETGAAKPAPRKKAARKAAASAPRGATARPAAPRGAKTKATAKAPATPKAAPARPSLTDVVTAALDDMKAQNVVVLDVRRLTDVADTIVVASGTSDRHVKSLAGRVVERAKEAGYRPYGVEGERDGEWVLVDLHDLVVHVMLPRVREFYGLEKLWDVRSAERAAG